MNISKMNKCNSYLFVNIGIFSFVFFLLIFNSYIFEKDFLYINRISVAAPSVKVPQKAISRNNPIDDAVIILIPSGFSYIGNHPGKDSLADASETGPRLVYLDDFYIYCIYF